MRLPDGNLLVSVPPHYVLGMIIYEMYRLKVYESVQRLEPGMTVLDVGASIGVFTLKASRVVGPSGRVIAIEPDPESFDALQKNLAANNCTNVEAVNVAAWSSYGTLQLDVSVKPTNRFIVPPEPKTVTVQAVPLDAILNRYEVRSLDFVKIDVEGAAQQVLEGMSNALLHTKHVAIAAYHKQENIKEMAAFLQAKGFNVTIHRVYFGLVPYLYASR